MIDLKIGGVPEHFNYPWYISFKNKSYISNGINLRWKDFGGGTGAMNKALRNKEIDIAIILTEGIIKDIIDGNPCKIVQPFVESPLIWGIHTSSKSKFKNILDLKNATAAISRYGSGSHLMAIVNAYNNGWDIENIKFKEVGNLAGGIDALQANQADYFMWEHFTTKPLVDKGIFKILGNCPTPWPCFVIAVRNEVLEQYPNEIKYILSTINSITSNFKNIKNIDHLLANRYNQKLEDIQKWLTLTRWNSICQTDFELIDSVQKKLLKFKIIEKPIDTEKLIKNL